ncbi:DoxX family protein [Leptolyngbya sp. 7M]|uniref:DoxX family protein n=1 Tax=Leptolyngbya sp. 7M TaxID=2812896 RepID=UPI001B8A99BA|nr:DoxX family protein [Leptolyngbya sp. 7M]QYO67265.1 DoxX family protein [Leptolyngbya sp. 7M]
MSSGDKHSNALIIIRVLLAAVMFIHGAARISNGTVGGFGEYLGSQGFPLGYYLAWGITLFELVGSVLLAAGFYTWVIALIFVLQLSAGIYLIHWKEGWFVVGAGRNGMELSVVLIVSFLAIAYATYKKPERSFRSR